MTESTHIMRIVWAGWSLAAVIVTGWAGWITAAVITTQQDVVRIHERLVSIEERTELTLTDISRDIDEIKRYLRSRSPDVLLPMAERHTDRRSAP